MDRPDLLPKRVVERVDQRWAKKLEQWVLARKDSRSGLRSETATGGVVRKTAGRTAHGPKIARSSWLTSPLPRAASIHDDRSAVPKPFCETHCQSTAERQIEVMDDGV
jgi:hypothetical protein